MVLCMVLYILFRPNRIMAYSSLNFVHKIVFQRQDDMREIIQWPDTVIDQILVLFIHATVWRL